MKITTNHSKHILLAVLLIISACGIFKKYNYPPNAPAKVKFIKANGKLMSGVKMYYHAQGKDTLTTVTGIIEGVDFYDGPVNVWTDDPNYDQICFIAKPYGAYLAEMTIMLDNDEFGSGNCGSEKAWIQGTARSDNGNYVKYRDNLMPLTNFTQVYASTFRYLSCFAMDTSEFSDIIFKYSSERGLSLKIKKKHKKSDTAIHVYLDDVQH